MLASNPGLSQGFLYNNNLSNQAVNAGLLNPAPQPQGPFISGGGGFGGSYAGAKYLPQNFGAPNKVFNYNAGGQGNPTINQGTVSSFAPQGFLQAGQAIPGQMQTKAFQFNQPDVNFQKYNPYQFNQVNPINVGDIFTPQYDLARRTIGQQFEDSQDQLISLLNKQGLYQTGATTKGIGNLMNNRDMALANSADQFAIQQAQLGLSEQQQARALDFQRQQSQAEELFKAQGVSDQQAQFLANLAMTTQQNQFQANTTAFNQNLAGRQQATAEEQLANFFRRQPLEDLFKLYQMQTGQIGPKEGDDGFLGVLAGLAGTFGGAAASKLF